MSDESLRAALADLGVRDRDAAEILANGREVPAAHLAVLAAVFATAVGILLGGRVLQYVRDDALGELRRGSHALISYQPGARWFDALGGPFIAAEHALGPVSHLLLVPVCVIAFSYLSYVVLRRFPAAERRLTASQIVMSLSMHVPGSGGLSVLRFLVRGGYRLDPEAPLLVSMNDHGRRLSLALLVLVGLPLCGVVALDDRAYTLVTNAGVERVYWNRVGAVEHSWSELRSLDLVCTKGDHGSVFVVLEGDFGDAATVTLLRDPPVASFATLRERFAPNVPMRVSTDPGCEQNLAARVKHQDPDALALAALLATGSP